MKLQNSLCCENCRETLSIGKAHVRFVKTEKERMTVEKTQQSVGAYHIAL
jgi:hypothetical protein